mmetsp:Transcript_16631/g.18972  ORF Transcript_16631/g.18972 Transcript_16631/m.18972 type:complete len:553 (+) Transcript_16631:188-1846(+)
MDPSQLHPMSYTHPSYNRTPSPVGDATNYDPSSPQSSPSSPSKEFHHSMNMNNMVLDNSMVPDAIMSSQPINVKQGSAKKTPSSPGKKSHKKKDGGDAPVFLRKTYAMIEECDKNGAIASWSDEGDTFIVKNPDFFAKEIIPKYFKHSNFSSFVRQLNFYGFKKIKNDPIRLEDTVDPPETKYWRFRHDKFLKGREDLLIEIKKSNQNQAADQEEVNALKSEVTTLKDQLSEMKDSMEKITTLMNQMQMNAAQQHNSPPPQSYHQHAAAAATTTEYESYLPNDYTSSSQNAGALSGHKRVKVEPEYQINPPTQQPPPQPQSQPQLPSHSHLALSAIDNYLPEFPITGLDKPQRGQSTTSTTSFDASALDDLLGFDDIPGSLGDFSVDDHALHSSMNSLALIPSQHQQQEHQLQTTAAGVATSASSPGHMGPSNETIFEVNPNLRQQFHYALSCLPMHMQKLFVERLISMVQNPETMQNQLEAVNALASAAARVGDDDKKAGSTGDVPLQLAVATLGAFLTQYAKAKNLSNAAANDNNRYNGRSSFYRQLDNL